MPDEKNNITNKFAMDELEKLTKKIISCMPIHIEHNFMGFSKMIADNSIKDNNCMRCLFLCNLCFSYHNYFGRKQNTSAKEMAVLYNLTTSLLENTKGLLFSYMLNDHLTVIQKYRMVYECYVIFLFINSHIDLAVPFLENIKIIENKIYKDIENYSAFKENNISKDDLDYFGWTKNAIPEKSDRNLHYMAKNVGMDDKIGFLYKLSSNFIHTNSYSAFRQKSFDKLFIQSFLPFVTDIMIRNVTMFLEKTDILDYQKTMLRYLLVCVYYVLFPELKNSLNENKS